MELEAGRPLGRRRDHRRALGACGFDGSAAPIIIVRSMVSPRPGMRGRPVRAPATAAAHRDVHRQDRTFVALGQQTDRQVVEDATVHQQRSSSRCGGNSTGSAADALTAVDSSRTGARRGTAEQVDAHAPELAGSPSIRRSPSRARARRGAPTLGQRDRRDV